MKKVGGSRWISVREITARTDRPPGHNCVAVTFGCKRRDESDRPETLQYRREHTRWEDCALLLPHSIYALSQQWLGRYIADNILQRPLRSLCTSCF
jgi:hypothetical protein